MLGFVAAGHQLWRPEDARQPRAPGERPRPLDRGATAESGGRRAQRLWRRTTRPDRHRRPAGRHRRQTRSPGHARRGGSAVRRQLLVRGRAGPQQRRLRGAGCRQGAPLGRGRVEAAPAGTERAAPRLGCSAFSWQSNEGGSQSACTQLNLKSFPKLYPAVKAGARLFLHSLAKAIPVQGTPSAGSLCSALVRPHREHRAHFCLPSSARQGTTGESPAGSHEDDWGLSHLPYKERPRDLGLFSLEKTEKGSHQCFHISDELGASWTGPGSFQQCPATECGAVGTNRNTGSSMLTQRRTALL